MPNGRSLTVDELKVLIDADQKQFKGGITQAINMTKTFGKEATKHTNVAAAGFKSLGKVVKYVIGAVVIRQVARGISALTKLSSSVIESENLFRVSMGSMASEARDWSNQLSNALGLSPYDLRRNVGLLNSMATNLGIVKDVAYLTSKSITQLSYDLSSYYNKRQEDSFESLIAALTGEGESLKRNYAVIVNETTTMQTALKYGIITMGQTMTEQQKYLARYLTIIDSTKQAQGDLARTIDSPANQMRILSNNFKMAGKALGDFFLPFIQVTLPYANALTSMLKDLFTVMAGWSRALFGIKDAGEEAGQATEAAYTDASTAIGDAAKEAKKATAGFDEINNLQSGSAQVTASTTLGIDIPVLSMPDQIKTKADEIRESIQSWWDSDKIVSFRNILSGVWSTLGKVLNTGKSLYTDFIKPWAKTISESIDFTTLFKGFSIAVNGMDTLWRTVFTPIFTGIKTVTANTLEDAKRLWDTYGSGIIDSISGFVLGVADTAGKLWNNVLYPIIQPFLKMLSWLWNEHLRGMANSIRELVIKSVSAAFDIYNGFIKPVIDMFIVYFGPPIANAIAFVLDLFGSIVGFIADVYKGIYTVLGGIIDFIAGVFTADWQRVWEGVKSVFKGVFDSLYGLVKLPLNLIIDAINFVIRGLNRISLDVPASVTKWFGEPNGVHFGVDIKEIDKLARGGIVTQPTFAQLGEGGKKEAIVPLENTAFVDKLASALGSAVLAAMNVSKPQTAAQGAGGEIILEMDGIRIGRAILPHIEREYSRQGKTDVIIK